MRKLRRVDAVIAAAEQLVTLVEELCGVAPVMLVVDDLQWADPATVLTLARLARLVRQVPLLLFASNRLVPQRDDVNALRRALEPDGVLALAGLAEDEVSELVTKVLGGAPGEGILRLAAGAAGNPLYLTELLDALLRTNALVWEDGRVDASDTRTPGSLATAIAQRLAFLSPPARAALRVAALLGRDLAVSELAVVSGWRTAELLPLLDEAIAAGVLQDKDAGLAFRHPLIRAALYEGIPAAVRAALHRDAARTLADAGAAAYRVARQLLPGRDPDKGSGLVDGWVIGWLADAGHELVGHVPDVAIQLLRWAIGAVPAGVSPHGVLACRLAEALYRVGDADAGAEVAAAALSHVRHSDLRVNLYWTLVECRALTGRSQDSLHTLQLALQAPDIQPQERTRLLVLIARIHRANGRVDRAGQVAGEALAEATGTGDRWAIGWALSVLATVSVMHGEAAKALPLLNQGLTAAQTDPALSDLRLLLQVNTAATLADLDRYEEAISAVELACRWADDAGNVVRLEQAQTALSELLFDVGRWDDALAEIERLFGMRQDPAAACCARGIAAIIGLHRGDDTAQAHLATVKQDADRIGDRTVGPFALAQSLQREQADAPREALAVLMPHVSGSREKEEMGDLLADAVRLAIETRDQDTAKSLVVRAAAVAGSCDVPHWQAVAAHCRGLLDRDPQSLLAAADHYQTSGRLLPRAQALEAAGMTFAERGNTGSARRPFTAAYALYESLGAHWDQARIQAAFRRYGVRRGPRTRRRQADHGWDSLTPTEMKVVDYILRGMSNPAIATHLFLSPRTVQTHVSHVLTKLDLSSRIDIMREASQRRFDT
jgi:DNA-binding CsgD family transcriptional regulator/tetratricopeptide (TPR) repeat protein